MNDTDADARRVVKLLANLNCKVNLIALNPGPGIPFETPDPERVAASRSIVRRSVPCFIRKPRGLDIFAACGNSSSSARAPTCWFPWPVNKRSIFVEHPPGLHSCPSSLPGRCIGIVSETVPRSQKNAADLPVAGFRYLIQ